MDSSPSQAYHGIIPQIEMPFDSNHPQFISGLLFLPNKLKQLYYKIFDHDNQNTPLQWLLPFPLKQQPNTACHQIVGKQHQSFRCFDCSLNSKSIICRTCFEAGDHVNHRYKMIQEEGDCDCGNPNIIKPTGFCHSHQHQEEKELKISNKERVKFLLMMRQIFLWIIKLQHLNYTTEAIWLLEKYLNYLIFINKQSKHYNQLTTLLLFEQNDMIIDQLVDLTLKKIEEKNHFIALQLQLFFQLLSQPTFRQQMIVKFIKYYNQIHNFQLQDYCKIFYSLMTYSDSVIQVYQKNPITLLPKRSYDCKKHLYMLMIIKDIDRRAARAFITPRLIYSYINFTYLQDVEVKVQQSNKNIVEVFPEFINEELLYYKLMINIIQIIQDKVILQRMLVNYYLMIRNYSFKNNKIILVPHRVFVLLLYKYFDYDYDKISFDSLVNIFRPYNIDQAKVNTFITQILYKLLECLHQYAKQLNQTTYFQNYLPLYLNHNAQIIQIDYLGIKVLSLLDHSIVQKQMQILFWNLHKNAVNSEKKAEVFRSKITLMKILVEIIYTPRTQIMILSFLGQHITKREQITEIFMSICRNIQQMTLQQVQSIGRFVCIDENQQNLFLERLSYDKTRKKYKLKQSIETDQLNLACLQSLVLTKMNKFLKSKTQAPSFILNDSQEHFKNILMPLPWFREFLYNQFRFINKHPKYSACVKQLINLMKDLQSFYLKQRQAYSQLFYSVELEFFNRRFQSCYNHTLAKQELEQLIGFLHKGSTKCQEQERRSLEESEKEKKKCLLQAKKEQFMVRKKVKENQGIFVKEKEGQSSQSQQVCLICKDNSNADTLCYLGKFKMTDLMFNSCKKKGQNLIFRSCFHPVHLHCYKNLKLKANNSFIYCPLCKSACNTILPLSSQIHPDAIDYILNQLKAILNKSGVKFKSIIFECMLSMVYLIISRMGSRQNDKRYNKMGGHMFLLMKYLYQINENEGQSLMAQIQNYKHKFRLNEMESEEYIMKIRAISLFMIDAIALHLQTQQIDSDSLQQFIELQLPETNQVLQYLQRILSLEEHQLQLIKLPNQHHISPLLHFYQPPPNITSLLNLRTDNPICKAGHQIMICIVCQYRGCYDCKQVKDHANTHHLRQSLFFNLYTGGLYYTNNQEEISIKSQYISERGQSWSIVQEGREFYFNEEEYKVIIEHFKQGNLYSYLINNYEGLKGKEHIDRI